MKISAAGSTTLLLPLFCQGFIVPLMAKGTSATPSVQRSAAGSGSSEVEPQGDQMTTRGKEELSERDRDQGRVTLRHPWRRASDMLSNWERAFFGPDILPFSVGDLLSEDSGEQSSGSSALTSFFNSPSMGHLDISEVSNANVRRCGGCRDGTCGGRRRGSARAQLSNSA